MIVDPKICGERNNRTVRQGSLAGRQNFPRACEVTSQPSRASRHAGNPLANLHARFRACSLWLAFPQDSFGDLRRTMGRAGRVGITILFLLAAHLNLAENLTSPLASVNDNRIPAGQVRNGTLTLRLELRGATWSPESDTGIHRDVYAFAEEGHEPQIPGPLLRVPQGTVIHATLHNRLPEAAKVYGLHRHPGDAKDAIPLAPGELREVQFEAGEPGTYFYWATTANRS